MSKFIHALETGLFQARWILAPLYVGLVLALVALVIRFCIEFFHLVQHVGTTDPHTFTLDLLALLDLTLLGNLILIVIFAALKRKGRVAEWLGRGLQNLVQRFESALDLKLKYLKRKKAYYHGSYQIKKKRQIQ